MGKAYDLSRFESAHRADYNTALEEVKQGRKLTHWMWYIFPILRGMGRSSTAQKYALQNKDEATAFLNDPYLGGNLVEISGALLKLDTDNATDVFCKPDDWKLHACMTLFSIVDAERTEKGKAEYLSVFDEVLEKYFGGRQEGRTLVKLQKAATELSGKPESGHNGKTQDYIRRKNTVRKPQKGTLGKNKGDEQNEKKAAHVTLAIGIGGRGISCLRMLKRKVYESVLSDDVDTERISYSHIKFLAVDGYDFELLNDRTPNSLDLSTEFFKLTDQNTMNMMHSIGRVSKLPEYQWLRAGNAGKGEPGIKILTDDSYPPPNRQIARMMMINKSLEFKEKVMQLILDAEEGLPDLAAGVSIHVFTGLGGTTGSGIFLDVCYLIQKAIDDLGLSNHALTYGYVFLPDVTLSVPSVAANIDYSFLMSNGYAAMKELDYCMNFDINGGEWEQQYNGFHYGPVKSGPVQMCHVVSANTINGLDKDHIDYNTVLNVVSDYALQLFAQNFNDLEQMAADYYSVSKRVLKNHGAGYNYILIGGSKAAVPLRKIKTYLTCALFEHFAYGKYRKPTEDEVDQFILECSLDFSGLRKQIMRGTSYNMPPIELPEAAFRSMHEDDLDTENLILPSAIVKPYRNMRAGMEALADSNLQSLTAEWSSDTDEDIKNRSLVFRVYRALEEVTADPEKGPYYAVALLNSAEDMNLIRKISEVREMIRHQRSKEKADLKTRISAVKEARSKYLHISLGNSRKRLFNAFIREVAVYYTCICKLRSFDKMEKMITILAARLSDLHDHYFEPYCNVYGDLLDKLHGDYIHLTHEDGLAEKKDPFTLNIVELNSGMRDLLKHEVESIDPHLELGRFNREFFNEQETWCSGEKSGVLQIVSDYIDRVFDNWLSKGLTDYLGILFNTDIDEIIQNRTFTEIMKPLSKMAAPLYMMKPYSISEWGKTGFIAIPEKEKCIQNAARKLIEHRPELGINTSSLDDRISLFQIICGVPLFSYAGTDKYREAYKADRTIGKHIYEGTDSDPRDWRELPNLEPFSTIAYPSKEMLENAGLCDEAIREGIIRKQPDGNQGHYELDEYEPIDEIEKLAEHAVDEHDLQEIYAARMKVEAYLLDRKPVKRTFIQNDGNSGYEELVRKDYIIGSTAMIRAIKEQLNILEKARKIIKEEQRMQASAKKEVEFSNALLTGVIKFNNPIVTYVSVNGEEENKTVLSDPSVQPYGRFVPLYQGFLSYTEMDEGIRNKIVHEVENRLNNIPDYYKLIKEACDSLESILSDRYLGVMQMQAQKIPKKTAVIETFFMNLRIGVDNFRLMYGIRSE